MSHPPDISGRSAREPSATAPLLVTMGDPLGIGPECIVQAHLRGSLGRSVVIGATQVLRRASAALGVAVPIARIERVADGTAVPAGCLAVIEPADMPAGLERLPWGQVHAAAGAAAARCIEMAVQQLKAGNGSALVTAPIHKAALSAAGVDFPGHTEMLQSLLAEGGVLMPVRMMLANDELRVVLVTIHQSLRNAIDALTFDAVLTTVQVAHAAAASWGLQRPRIGVAGLNPHAGEDGLFGREEIDVIAPAIAAARAKGIDARGPYAPDTVFMRARNAPDHRGEFDLVIAMIHDHGLIPVKYLGVEKGVNVTLGLPHVRTSPDHGTAFDIAGRGLADPRSLEAALRWATAAVLRRASLTPEV
jgi:4-hydroxythreonine-4-phosphate dehydrogenase